MLWMLRVVFSRKKCQDSSRRTFKCVNSTTIFDVFEADDGTSAFSDVCSADHNFYQPCGFNSHNTGESTNELICGEFVCQTTAGNKSNDCTDQIESNSCGNLEVNYTAICPKKPETSFECDLICNDITCIDESRCNGFIYGKYCDDGHYIPTLHLIYLDVIDIYYGCHIYDPYPGDRESFLANYYGPVCQHEQGGKTFTIPIFNYTRCASFKYDLSIVADTEYEAWWVTSTKAKVLYCSDLMDQTNCTDSSRIALYCLSKGYQSSVSILAICHGFNIKICDDGIENDCRQLTHMCCVHKHKMCDGIADCEDFSDETNHDCKQMVNIECVRILGNSSLPIPLVWLGDGITDCISRMDEDPVWPT